jgi:hypothetical protein
MAHPGRDARSFQVLGIILDAMFLQKNYGNEEKGK